jgi:hypothetical protein
MTLTRLLKIDEKLVPAECREGFQLAERLWRERNSPREAPLLCALLETILTTCQEHGITYPPILLRRKKEIERGDFLFQQPPTFDQNGVCSKCKGRGYYTTPAGTGSLCPCESWKKTIAAKTS